MAAAQDHGSFLILTNLAPSKLPGRGFSFEIFQGKGLVYGSQARPTSRFIVVAIATTATTTFAAITAVSATKYRCSMGIPHRLIEFVSRACGNGDEAIINTVSEVAPEAKQVRPLPFLIEVRILQRF
jgi:hypothetical protein